MAFPRLLTNRAVMGSQVLSPSAAWAKTSDFVRLPEVELLDEPLGVEDAWSRFAMAVRYSPNLWTDAYLAAFAVRAGLRLVSFCSLEIFSATMRSRRVSGRREPAPSCGHSTRGRAEVGRSG